MRPRAPCRAPLRRLGPSAWRPSLRARTRSRVERVEQHFRVRLADGLVHLGEESRGAAADEFEAVLPRGSQAEAVAAEFVGGGDEHPVEFEHSDTVLEL